MDTLRNLKSPLPLPLCYSFLRLTLIHHTPHEDIPKPHSYFDLVLCSVFLYHFAERQFLIWIPSCFLIFFIKNMYHYFSLNLLMNDQFLLTQMFALWFLDHDHHSASCVFYVLYAWTSQRITGSDFLHALFDYFFNCIERAVWFSIFQSCTSWYHWNKNVSFWFLMLLCYQAGQKCPKP